MTDASESLRSLGIRHALVGGLAVGAYGWPRATRDVDFLVDDSAFVQTESGVLMLRAGMPVQAHGIAIDTISVRDDERHLLAAIEAAEISEGVPVAPLEALVYLKLASPRSQDRQDVFNLVRAGADLSLVRRYLSAHAPNLVQKLEAHDFDPGTGVDTCQQVTIPVGSTLTLVYQWDQPFFSVSGPPGSASDMDIVLTDAACSRLLSASAAFNEGNDPVEIFDLYGADAMLREFFDAVSTMLINRPGAGGP